MSMFSGLRQARPARGRRPRLLTNPAVRSALISVAGLVGVPVRNPRGDVVGSVADVVVSWQGEAYPAVTGLVVRVGRRQAWVHAGQVDAIGRRSVTLRDAKVALEDFVRRPGEVPANSEVIDHQMVDVDGVRVFRAADLYLARVGGRYLLVGADVGLTTLVRRLGPARWRAIPTPERVIDWAAIQPFNDPGGPVRLTRPNAELARLRPGELADLLEDLGRHQRRQLLTSLGSETAADALEEMHADDLRALLRELPAAQAARIVAHMEPDEAADALGDLDPETRDALLAQMPGISAARFRQLLGYPEDSAGGLMTTRVITVETTATVSEVRHLLAAVQDATDVAGVAVVDSTGALVADLLLIQLLATADDDIVGQLATGPAVTVGPEASLTDVITAFVECRAPSVVVVDDVHRPLGRILADDIIDVLVRDRPRVPKAIA